MLHLSHNKHNGDERTPFPNRQQNEYDPPPTTKECHLEKLRKLEGYSASSSTSRGGKSRGRFVSSKKGWTGQSDCPKYSHVNRAISEFTSQEPKKPSKD